MSQRPLVFLAWGLLGVAFQWSTASAVSMVANQSAIKSFLGGKGGVLVFSDKGDGGKVKYVDINDSSLTIKTVSQDTGIGVPGISPDGTRVLYVLNRKVYARWLSGGKAVEVGVPDTTSFGRFGFSSSWYREGGTDYVLYYDATDKWKSFTGDTYIQKIKNGIEKDGARQTIYSARAMSAGRSGDGRWLGETYGENFAYDLVSKKEYGPSRFLKKSGGKEGQTCNGSMSPDGSGRLLCLVLPHDYIRLFEYKSSTDNFPEVKTFVKPSGMYQWQTPRYSTLPNYFTALVEKVKDGPYDLYLVRISDDKRLKLLAGDIGGGTLYVGATNTQPPPPPPANPTIALSPGTVTFTAKAGGNNPAPKTVQVTNSGSGTLSKVTATENAAWLTVSQSGTGNSQTLSNTVDISGLATDKTHSTTVTVLASGASKSASYTVEVTWEAPAVSITILTPNGGEAWAPGSTQTITWTTQNLADVKITYSTDNGKNWVTITDSVDDSKPSWSQYPWVVPDSPTNQALIQIDGYFNEASARSSLFEITSGPDLTPPGITLSLLGVAGTLDDLSVAKVLINGSPFTVTSGKFSGEVTLGIAIQVQATDAAGNSATRNLSIVTP